MDLVSVVSTWIAKWIASFILRHIKPRYFFDFVHIRQFYAVVSFCSSLWVEPLVLPLCLWFCVPTHVCWGVERPLTPSTLLIDRQILFGHLPYLVVKDLAWSRWSMLLLYFRSLLLSSESSRLSSLSYTLSLSDRFILNIQVYNNTGII